MKLPLFLILSACCTVAGAQTPSRCDDTARYYPGLSCARGGDAEVLQPGPPVIADPAAVAAAAAKARLLAEQRERAAEAQRMRVLLKQSGERLLELYGENRQRCEKALRIAALCGNNAGIFYCNERGFSMNPALEAGADHGMLLGKQEQYSIEQCARHAAMGEGP